MKLTGVFRDYAKASGTSSGFFKQNHGLGWRQKWRDFTGTPHVAAMIPLHFRNELLIIFPLVLTSKPQGMEVKPLTKGASIFEYLLMAYFVRQ